MANEEYFKARNEALEKLIAGVNQEQFGGSHYKKILFQHWDFVIANDLGYFEGQVTKYVCRWRDKNGIQDLEKALHYLAKLISAIRHGNAIWHNRGTALQIDDLAKSYPDLTIPDLKIIRLMCVYDTVDELLEAGVLIQSQIEEYRQQDRRTSLR